jgi:two-component system, NarL family, response regulator NreC
MNEAVSSNPSTISLLPKKARILIVDDHVIVRQGIAQLVNREPDLDVCQEAGDADSAQAVLRETAVDLAIVDISLPGTSGIELVKLIRDSNPNLPVLVMSMHDEALYSDRAFRAGAKGYVMKQEATEKLLAAIRKILNGGVYVSDRMQTVMVQRFLNSGVDETVSFIDNLTDREFEILRMIGQGLTVAEIADKLGRSAKTVEAHRANLREKLGLKRAAELARFATQWVERGN